MNPLKYGDTIALHYKLSNPGGAELISTFAADPVKITLGQNQLSVGLEKLLVGSEPGKRYRHHLAAGMAFGFKDASLIQKIPLAEFEKQTLLEQDNLIEFTLPSGEIVTGTLIEKDGDAAIVDFNHPLVDRELIFEFEVLDSIPTSNSH